MKKNLLYILTAAVLVCSCLEEKPYGEGPQTPGKGGETTFSLIAAPYTKAVADQDLAVQWTAGDRISLLDGENNHALETTESGTVAKFTGNVAAAESYYAVYPYAEDASVSNGVLALQFPSAFTETVDRIPDPRSALWVGRSRGPLVVMNNICSTISFSFASEDVTQIVVRAESGQKLSGPVYVTIDEDSTPSVSIQALDGETITVSPASGGTFAPGTHSVTILSGKYPGGLSFSFVRTGEGNVSVRKINTISEVKASSYIELGEFDLDSPEIKSVTLLEPSATGGSGAVLCGSMEIFRFDPDKVSCGFEYRLSADDQWTSVECETAAENFSCHIKGLPYTSEPVTYRAWAMVDGYRAYSEEEKTFTMKPLHLVTVKFIAEDNLSAPLLIDEWKWKTNGKMLPTEDYNDVEYTYTDVDGITYSFRFWATPEPDAPANTTYGYCIRAISPNKDNGFTSTHYYGVCLNYWNGADHPGWMLLPSLEGARLVKIDARIYDANSYIYISGDVDDGGFPVTSTILSEKKSPAKDSTVTFELDGTEFSKRYYLSSDTKRTTVSSLILYYQYE